MMAQFIIGILEITLTMSVVIPVFVFLARLFGGRFTAKCRYVVWAVVIIRLCIPFGVAFVPTLVTFDIPATIDTPTVAEPQKTGKAFNNSVSASSVITEVQPQVKPSQTLLSSPETPAPTETESEQTNIQAFAPTKALLHTTAYIWLFGAAVYLIFKLAQYNIAMLQLRSTLSPASEETKLLYHRLCGRLDVSAPSLYISGSIHSPMLCGYFRPSIILPDITLTPNSAVGILTHELTHYKRGDLWVKLFCLAAESVHWFNPLVHIAVRHCNTEMELSCDETVLFGMDDEARLSYGNVMLDIIKCCKHNNDALTTQFNPRKSAVKERFMNILDMNVKRRGIWIIAAVVVICALAGTVVGCNIGDEIVVSTDDTPIKSGTQGVWSYNIYENYAEVTAYNASDTNTEIVVPDSFEGVPVKKIGDRFGTDDIIAVILPETVSYIGNAAFSMCRSLISLNIPDAVTHIGDGAFYMTPWFESLTEEFVIVGDGILIDYNGEGGEVVIPDGVKAINGAFMDNKAVTGVVIPESLTEICSFAFGGSMITGITIPGSVTEIGLGAFIDTGLVSLAIPGSVKSIGASAFTGCTALESITLPEGIKMIEAGMFSNCEKLKSVKIPESVMKIGAYAFNNCFALENINIPSGVIEIGNRAFNNCRMLTVTISNETLGMFTALELNIPFTFDGSTTENRDDYSPADVPGIINVRGSDGNEIGAYEIYDGNYRLSPDGDYVAVQGDYAGSGTYNSIDIINLRSRRIVYSFHINAADAYRALNDFPVADRSVDAYDAFGTVASDGWSEDSQTFYFYCDITLELEGESVTRFTCRNGYKIDVGAINTTEVRKYDGTTLGEFLNRDGIILLDMTCEYFSPDYAVKLFYDKKYGWQLNTDSGNIVLVANWAISEVMSGDGEVWAEWIDDAHCRVMVRGQTIDLTYDGSDWTTQESKYKLSKLEGMPVWVENYESVEPSGLNNNDTDAEPAA